MLSNLSQTTHVNDLDFQQAAELQKKLSQLGFYDGYIDGIVGNITRKALADFKQEEWLAYPHLIGKSTMEKLEEALDDQKLNLLPYNTNLDSKEAVIQAIISECDRQALPLKSQKAYLLATAEWETNYTFEPVKEAYWLSEAWRMGNLRYAPFFG